MQRIFFIYIIISVSATTTLFKRYKGHHGHGEIEKGKKKEYLIPFFERAFLRVE